MNLLVTGGLGFIGSNFIRYMLKEHQKMKITNVDKIGIGANLENLKNLDKSRKYKFVKMDITDPKGMEKLVKKTDAIINFAAETHVDRSISNPTSFFKSNTLGTLNILEAVRKYKKEIRIVQISTDETYGDLVKGSFNEQDRLSPSNPYSASKASADMICLAYERTYKLNIVITRCTNNFGPYQFPEKLIPKTIIRGYKNLSIPVYGTGVNVRDWIYVIDHCAAVHLVLDNGRSGEIYNVSSNNELENLTVVYEILHLLGKKKNLIKFVDDRPGHDLRYSLDSSKLKEKLGWKPRYKFVSALKKTVDWYVRNESWWKSLISE
jgi:dTDP-glucose 4,6-dehydratase